MKLNILFCMIFLSLLSCSKRKDNNKKLNVEIQGTWQLVSAITIEDGLSDTLDYTGNLKMIKIFNGTHFAFLKHSVIPKDSTNFDAGGGSYVLKNGDYSETLAYYKDKNWEGKSFNFKIAIQHDTLIQKGVELVEKAGIDRVIIEKYVKVKPQ